MSSMLVCLDFDGTLAPGNMQDHVFIPDELGMDRAEFWAEVNALAQDPAVIVGGMDSSWRAVTTSSSAGPSWARNSSTAPARSSGRSTRRPWIPSDSASAAKSGFSRSVP